MGDHIVVHLQNAPVDEAAKGAVIGLPDIMCLGMEDGVQLRQSPFQPPCETKAITLHLEMETPLLPVRLQEVEAEIGRPGGIGHELLRNGDATSGRGIGMQTQRCVGIRKNGGPYSRGGQLLGIPSGLPRGHSGLPRGHGRGRRLCGGASGGRY